MWLISVCFSRQRWFACHYRWKKLYWVGDPSCNLYINLNLWGYRFRLYSRRQQRVHHLVYGIPRRQVTRCLTFWFRVCLAKCKRFRFRRMKLRTCHRERLRPCWLFRHALICRITTICLHFIWNIEEYRHLLQWRLPCHRGQQLQRCKIFNGSQVSNFPLTILPLQIDVQVLRNQHHLSSSSWSSRPISRLIILPHLNLHLIRLPIRLLLHLNLFP